MNLPIIIINANITIVEDIRMIMIVNKTQFKKQCKGQTYKTAKIVLLYVTIIIISIKFFNPLKGRDVNWLHMAIQI